MFKRLVISAVIAVLAVSCGGGKKQVSAPVRMERTFPSVSVPKMITDQEEAAEYASEHFWDDFADTSKTWLSDSVRIGGVDRTAFEEKVGMYASLLSMIPLDKARKDVKRFCSQMELFEKQDGSSPVFEESVAMVKRYLFDPNSPVRNEDIYGSLAEALSVSPCVPDSLRPSYAYDAELCALNRAGTPAADFSFVTRDGAKLRLYDIKAEYTLLFFVNPGCPACAEIIDNLRGNEKIENMVKGGTLAVVDIYIDDDYASWLRHAGDYPSGWRTGYDKSMTIRNGLLYNVRAIPSLYLLDKNKTVIMKDAPEDKVLSYLENVEE